MAEKCEVEGCHDDMEFRDPWGNLLCKDCVQREVDDEEYTWEEVERI